MGGCQPESLSGRGDETLEKEGVLPVQEAISPGRTLKESTRRAGAENETASRCPCLVMKRGTGERWVSCPQRHPLKRESHSIRKGKGPVSSLLDRRGAGDSKEKPLVVAGEGNRCRLMDENPTGSLLKELLQGKTKGSVSLQLSGSGKGGKEEALPPSVSRDTLGSLGGETGVEKGDEPALFQKLFGGRFNPLVVLTA